MRSTMTAVLERGTIVRAGFATEPYELPWASEVRFFVQTFAVTGDPAVLHLYTEISPDGLQWCGLDPSAHRIDGPGLSTWAVSGFGQWLRVRCATEGSAEATVRIYLVGKG